MAKADIGPKIGIDGEAEFKKQLSSINSEIKTLGTEMKATTTAFAGNEKSQKSLTAQNKVLAQQMEASQTKINLLKSRIEEATKAYGEDSSQVQKLKQNLNKTTAELNTQKAQFDSNKESMTSFGDVAGSIGKVAAAGIAAFTAAVAAAGTAIINATKASAEWADNINTMSTTYSIATDELQKFEYASELIDVSTETLTGSLKKLTNNMDSAAEGSGTAYEAFKELGVSVTDSNGELRDSNTVFNETIAALGNISNETERDAVAMDIFGKSAQELNPLIEGGAETLQLLGDHAEEVGLIMGQDALDSLNAFNDSLDTLSATATQAGHVLTADFAEPLSEITDLGTSALEQIVSAYNEGGFAAIGGALGNILQEVLTALVDKLPEILDFGISLVNTLAEGIVSALPKIVTAAAQLITQLINSLAAELPTLLPLIADAIIQCADAIVQNLPIILQAILQVITAVISSILKSLPEIISGIGTLIGDIVEFVLGDGIPMILEAILSLVQTIAEDLPDIINAIVEMLPTLIDTILTALLDNLPTIILAVVDIIVAIAEALPDIIIEIIEVLPQLISDIIKALVDHIPDFVEAGYELFSGIGSRLGEAFTNLISDVWQWCLSVVEKIKGVKDDIIQAGKDWIAGLWEGVSAKVEWLKNKLKSFCSTALNAIKDFFGIHSPSKVMRDQVGVMLAEGIGEGFENGMDDVASQMQSSINGLSAAQLTASVGASGVQSMQDTASGIVNGIAAATTGNGTYTFNLVMPDGTAFARYYFDSFVQVGASNGTPILNPV